MAKEEKQSPLAKLGLNTPADLALHLPIRYEDETELFDIGSAISKHSQFSVQTQGRVIDSQVTFRPKRQLIIKIADENDELILRFIHFYPSQQKQMAVGLFLRVRGEIRHGFYGPEMVHPAVKVSMPEAPLPNQLTPVYSTVAGVSQTLIRKAIEKGLSDSRTNSFLREIIPMQWFNQPKYDVLKGLPSLEIAIRTLHQPLASEHKESLLDRTHLAWRRVQFEELLAQQVSLQQAHVERRKRLAPILQSPKNGYVQKLLNKLPFELTAAQAKVWQEIAHDLSQPFPMNRLLQGDVGSGKTAVAALAAACALDNGYQVALMAPTEILAEQHFQKLVPWFEEMNLSIGWLTGSLKAKAKREVQEQIMSGALQLVIGTHALIQEGVSFAKLGLAIIDEQHRFGVLQRLQLYSKNGDQAIYAHQLMMTATPIPRTLAMTYYADLEVSVIDQLPPGRSPIITRLIKNTRRLEVVDGIRRELLKGRQAYWVCPIIEESEALQLKTAIETYEQLTTELPQYQVGLIHGKLPAVEKSRIMQSFKSGEIQMLVSTTVIEVGVDVPNATLMVIEHAERFGYAQIHQLRGRVGRGSEQSVCLLMYAEPLSMAAKERLQNLRESNDGFIIAERDLELRGPGELLGAKQSGETMLRFVDLIRDAWLVEIAKDFAHDLLQNDPKIAHDHVQRWLGVRAELLKS
ncbi:ATP-dependent DNA helicase RecG [Polynucleobacter kasalickyi]|uniref:ATP-dependent DNA helicase RecG n=1 Tax=Polynucleobacter kasalickyi TaxID=1938817 RepID=A0A1W1YIQ0_9BURK|nr:ATP-dependent DNA helicase RecG [Polynucleobacter kasalickyi]SMC36055.1 ATP-dependent DNA helicase RecG [Polynucleobacter kasalickyi]